MLKYTRAFLFVALTFSVNAFAQETAPVTKTSAPQLTAAERKRLQTVSFESKLVGKTLPYIVVLPLDYDQTAARSKRYPVLYLLHGLTGHYTDWTRRTKLSHYAAQYSLIIVTPEGNNGWYTDSANVPTDKYETYILDELIPDVQRRYRTLVTREGRAIAGLSMGGYGAIKFGLKHPEMFAFTASMSSAFGAASLTEKELKDPGVIRDSVLQTFGSADSPTRAANDVFKLAREVSTKKIAPLPYFYFDCGTEDFLFSDNRNLASLFVELKIPHEYRQLPGNHSWTYWEAQVQEILKLAAERLRSQEPSLKSATR